LKTNRPIDLIQALADCIDRVKIAGKAFQRPDFDALVDGANFANSLDALKKASAQIMLSGQMAGFQKIAEIPECLKLLALNERPPEANEVFWDQLSKAYPIQAEWFFRTEALSDALELRILVQMISQHQEPEKVVKTELDRFPPHLFMNALTLSLKYMLPPEREFRIETADLLFNLRKTVIKHGMAKEAAQHIAKHQDLYFPFFKRVLQASLVPETIRDKKREGTDPVEAKIKAVFEELGLSQEGIKDVFEKTRTGDSIRVSGFTRLKKLISLPAELLAELHNITGHPLIKEIGELAIENPFGPTPYTFFEQMGVVRSPEWHKKTQDKSPVAFVLRLYEYAITTPGIELSVQKVQHQPLTQSGPEVMVDLISLVERTPVSDPECRRKGQVLFDALVFNALSGKSGPKLKELILSSKVDYSFFRSHPSLKGPRLEEALGL
jgi:hypothetical protein